MPTYEYKCRECAHRVEVVQAFTDKSLTKCTECGGSLGKVFGNIGISFKGSGFYRTDSRSAAKAAKSKETVKANGDSKADTKADTKSESKSEKKSETKTDSPAKSTAAEKKTPAATSK